MSLSAFEREVLGRVADDYEAADTIREDIARDLGRSVSEDELASALLTLARSGLVDAFVYDASSSQYHRADVQKSAVGDLWFLANKAGLSEYEGSGA